MDLKIVIVFVIFFGAISCAHFRWKDCGHEKEKYVFLKTLSVHGPIVLGEPITVSYQGLLAKPVNQSCTIKYKVWRTFTTFGQEFTIRMPCFFDSCKMPICEAFEEYHDIACPLLAANGTCECPPKPGIYSGKEVTIEYKHFLQPLFFMAKGRYKTKVEVKCGREVIGCLFIDVIAT